MTTIAGRQHKKTGEREGQGEGGREVKKLVNIISEFIGEFFVF